MNQTFKYVTCDVFMAPATMQLLNVCCTIRLSAQTQQQDYYYYYYYLKERKH